MPTTTKSYSTRLSELTNEAFEEVKARLRATGGKYTLKKTHTLYIDTCNGSDFLYELNARKMRLEGDVLNIIGNITKEHEKEVFEKGNWNDVYPNEIWTEGSDWYAEWEGLLELFDAFLEDTSKNNSLPEGKTSDKKKAFLVGFCPKTRVIIDVPDDYDGQEPSDSLTDEIIRTARQKMSSSLEDYLNGDNCDVIEEDLECPYNENDPSDNPDARYWVLVNRQGDRLFQYGKMFYEDEAQKVLRSAQKQHPTAGIHLERRSAKEKD